MNNDTWAASSPLIAKRLIKEVRSASDRRRFTSIVSFLCMAYGAVSFERDMKPHVVSLTVVMVSATAGNIWN
jgi:hypothetical protein